MAELPPELERIDKIRQGVHTDAAAAYRQNLENLSDNLGRRLAASLGVDPDKIVRPDGDDGRKVGRTDFEKKLRTLKGDAAALRASVLATSMEEIQQLVDAAGMDRASATLTDSFKKLAGLAEQNMTAAGLPASGALDTVAAAALLGGIVEGHLGDTVNRASLDQATRIKRGLTAGLTFQSMEGLAMDIHESTGQSIGRAVTEARTSLAEADRYTDDVLRKIIDPEEKTFLAYIGPDDGATRNFCVPLVNKFFTPAQFAKLRNGQGVSPRIMGGGYNCRHRILTVPGTEEDLLAMGLQKGTEADIQRANDGARRRRK